MLVPMPLSLEDIVILLSLSSLFLRHQCGSLNAFGSHKFIESGVIRGCDFVGVGVNLLEKVGHCGGWVLKSLLLKIHSL